MPYPSPFPLPPSQRAFTLVELLVALVVMGIALGMVLPQLMPDEQAQLDNEARRLALLLENASMEARASGRSLAWSAHATTYRFWRKNDYGDWVRIEDDTLLRPRQLPEGMAIAAVRVETQRLQEDELLPLLAGSFAPPFEITLTAGAARTQVIGHSTGRVEVRHDSLAQ